MDKVLCIGSSHLHAIKAGFQELISANQDQWDLDFIQLREARFKPTMMGGGKNLGLNPAITAAITSDISSRRPNVILTCIGGGIHAEVGLILYPEPFDFSIPARPELPLMAGADVLPYNLVFDAMVRRNRPFFSILRLLRGMTELPIYQLSPPPPSYDASGVAKIIHRKGKQHQLAPIELRYKLWHVHVETVNNFCNDNNITFLPCPPITLDAEGFLNPAMSAHDGVHGNAKYGELVLGDVLPRLRKDTANASL